MLKSKGKKEKNKNKKGQERSTGQKWQYFSVRGCQENDGTSVKNAVLSGSWFRWEMVSLDFDVLIACEQMAGY